MHSPAAERERLAAGLSSRQGTQRLAVEQMRRLSALCFEFGLAPAAVEWPDLDARLAVDPRYRLLVCEMAPGKLSCAANGQLFRIQASELLERLAERLNTREPATARELCGELAAGGSEADPLDRHRPRRARTTR